MAHRPACTHTTSATTVAAMRIDATGWGGEQRSEPVPWGSTGVCCNAIYTGSAVVQLTSQVVVTDLGRKPYTRRITQRCYCVEVPDGVLGVATIGGSPGLSQQACTRSLTRSGDFGSILPWRATHRNVCWRWSPGQPKRS